ncbi:hypothetical protein P691DRAFT_763431 [Macrolepiota fuliginosa MF-IS2]|uniref:F-box domain-containing protein n=1 Tax=Macrolepiota fuliginosa MF-IS2 TaxID=1400762 RepID=A0A9P6C0H8_9AGAR|nr:hypothetical protein P691DRAFT_763431 [Macrolepiota fuliginosa MF-IS2]
MTMDFLHGRRSVTLSKLDRDTVVSMAQDKPLPTLPNMAPIENIPRNRTGSSTAGEIIRRVSSMFSSRKKKPAGLKFAQGNISKIYESQNSSLQSLSDDEEDDIRRPSGLGSAVSISSNRSLPPSPFNPSHPQHSGPSSSNTQSPFGYMRARATSTPNLLRSFSLRSKGSIKKKTKPSRGNSTTSHTDSQAHPPVRTIVHNAVTILSIPAETIAIIFSHLPKSDVAQTGRTCRLFLHASRTVLYTHVDLGELDAVQLERFVAVLATRRDFTDLVRSFSCETWPRFFMTTISGSLSSPSCSVASPASTSPYTPNYHDRDPDTQHRDTLLTATFTLAFQRMSNLTCLTLPAYDHDLLAYHTAFGLRNITFMCSSLSRGEANELFAWLDGQTNITTLLFPNLTQDYDYGLPREAQNNTSRSRSPSRPATSSGLPTQSQNKKQSRSQNQGKKYLVAPYLVPLLPTPSPTTSSHRPPSPSPSPAPKPKLSPRPKTAAPSSPSYAHLTFSSSASSSGSRESESLRSRSPLPSPSSQIPFPTSDSSGSIKRLSTPIVTPVTPSYGPLQPVTSHIININPPTHPTLPLPLTPPTLLPNLTTLHGPPSLIIALSSPPSPTTNGGTNAPTTNRTRPRPLKTITLNISSTLYTGLRPTMIVNRLVGVTRSLGLRFGETVDRRTVEKVLGAAGSALGGSRSGVDGGGLKREGKEGALGKGYKFGEGEWKGLIQLEIGFVVGGPGSDEALHKMISSAIPRYPYLRVLNLFYTPTPIPASASNQTTLTFPTLSSVSTTNLLLPSPISGPTTPAPGASPPLTPVPTIFADPKRQSDGSVSLSASSGWCSGKGKELSPPEKAYVRQWTKHCPDLERVVFLSGGEWRRK